MPGALFSRRSKAREEEEKKIGLETAAQKTDTKSSVLHPKYNAVLMIKVIGNHA